jgi:hypothetical protein
MADKKKGMLDSYYDFVDKKGDDGGRTNLWLNNGGFFIGGMLVESKFHFFGKDEKKA